MLSYPESEIGLFAAFLKRTAAHSCWQLGVVPGQQASQIKEIGLTFLKFSFHELKTSNGEEKFTGPP
jgi:hypothetical protein